VVGHVRAESAVGAQQLGPFQERENPDLIDGSRRKRIAKGAGKDISEVNAFMKQFEQMRDMMKNMNKMNMFGKMMPGMKR